MKRKFTVRIELTVVESEFADVGVEATTKEEAIAKAIASYEEAAEDMDFYTGERVTTLDDTSVDWTVDEVGNHE